MLKNFPRLFSCFLFFAFIIISGQELQGLGDNASLVEAISDDFEDQNWSFDYVKNISSNGLWFGSFRGTPSILERVTPPPGGPTKNTGALRIRTNSAGAGQSLTQNDFVTQRYINTSLGKNLVLEDAPSYEMLVHYPASSQWKEGTAIGLRIAAKDTSLISEKNLGGSYHPSIWLVRIGSNIEIRGRFGDGTSPDFPIKKIPITHQGRIKIGIAWDSSGHTKYYARAGSGRITEADLLKTDTLSGRTMDLLDYHFLSLGYPENSDLSPDFVVDYVKVYKKK